MPNMPTPREMALRDLTPTIPEGWTVTDFHRCYPDSEGAVYRWPHEFDWHAEFRAAGRTVDHTSHPTREEAFAWCDEQAAKRVTA